MKKVTGYGLYGGVDVLAPEDRVIDSELAEKYEPENRRRTDDLDGVLAQLLSHEPGIRINQYMVDIEVPGSRNQQIEFDRYYVNLGLFVDMMQKPLNDADRHENIVRIAEHSKLAAILGKKYLAIQGSVTLEEIAVVMN